MSFNQYVVFNLGNEEYGVHIECAQEIIRIPDEITRMPNMPDFFEGMINLRGKVLPVIDLKKRFEYESTERNVDNRLLILDLNNTIFGFIVDDVSEVIMIEDEHVEGFKFDMPSLTMSSVKGIAKLQNRLILILDTTKITQEIFEYNYQLGG